MLSWRFLRPLGLTAVYSPSGNLGSVGVSKGAEISRIHTVERDLMPANDFHVGHHQKPSGRTIYENLAFCDLHGAWSFEKGLSGQG